MSAAPQTSDRGWLLAAARGEIWTDAALHEVAVMRVNPHLDEGLLDALEEGDERFPQAKHPERHKVIPPGPVPVEGDPETDDAVRKLWPVPNEPDPIPPECEISEGSEESQLPGETPLDRWGEECEERQGPGPSLYLPRNGAPPETPGRAHNSHDSLNSQNDGGPPWPKLSDDALHGPAGELVNLLAPCTEADPAAVLVTLLSVWGAIVGPGPHATGGHAKHPARICAVIVGDTAKARKGTSWATLRTTFQTIDGTFMASRVLGGFGSGEGVVDEVRDAADEDDQGATDKRLLLHEPEFAKVLKVCGRETSILSAVIRDAWDGTRLQTRSRAQKAVATGHHIAILGHVTAPELRRNLMETEIAGGFANRLLWICARRSKRLPFDEDPHGPRWTKVSNLLRDRAEAAKDGARVGFADDARDRWRQLYDKMADDDPGGMLGAIIARPEPHTLRLALTYALLDGAPSIRAEHLDAAYAVWCYSRASAAYIFGESIGDPVADALLRGIRQAGAEGLDFTAQSALLGRHIKAPRLAEARAELERRHFIETVEIKGKGRPKKVSRPKEHPR